MDLYSNEIGRSVATEPPGASPEQLADLVAAEVRKGSTAAIGDDGTINWTDRVHGRPDVGTTGILMIAGGS